MRIIQILLLFLLLCFIELVLVPFPLVFIALFLWQQVQSEKEAVVFAFAAGFLFDILLIRPLGSTAMLFMIALLLTILYKRKYHPKNALFLGTIVFVSVVVLDYFYTQHIHMSQAVFAAILTVFLARVFSPSFESVKLATRQSRLR